MEVLKKERKQLEERKKNQEFETSKDKKKLQEINKTINHKQTKQEQDIIQKQKSGLKKQITNAKNDEDKQRLERQLYKLPSITKRSDRVSKPTKLFKQTNLQTNLPSIITEKQKPLSKDTIRQQLNNEISKNSNLNTYMEIRKLKKQLAIDLITKQEFSVKRKEIEKKAQEDNTTNILKNLGLPHTSPIAREIINKELSSHLMEKKISNLILDRGFTRETAIIELKKREKRQAEVDNGNTFTELEGRFAGLKFEVPSFL